MKVLIACEYSGIVREAFKARGHDAWSCDLLDTEIPGNHYKCDATEILALGWDLMIAHPPCTYFSRAGMHFLLTQNGRKEKLEEAFQFVKKLWQAPIEKICLENPVGWLNTNWRQPKQIVHPWYFGDNDMKQTCFWLKNLVKLNGKVHIALDKLKYRPKPDKPGRIGKDGKMRNFYFMSRSRNAKDRSKTFSGIAKAMAEQWGS